MSFIVFTVENPDAPELLNNYKTTRQVFAYKPGNGVLLQSRFYNQTGGTSGYAPEMKWYREIVQRVICEGEGAINRWTTGNYCDSPVNIPRGDGFQGYADWLEFSGNTVKLSIRKDRADNYEAFTVGTYALCVKCGEEIYDFDRNNLTHYCHICDTRMRCDECGCFVDEESYAWVIDAYGDEILVCEECLDAYYFYCDICNRWHRHSKRQRKTSTTPSSPS